MLINEGKNRVRDLIVADLTNGELGTDGTGASASDTGLIAPVAATIVALSITTADKQLIADYSLSSTTGNGNTYKEYELQLSAASTSLNRSTFYDVPKDSTEEMQISTIVDIQ